MSKLLQTQVGMVSVGHPILALFTWQPSWVMSPFCIRRSRSTSKICVNVKLLERYAVNLSGPHHDETVDDFSVHKRSQQRTYLMVSHNKDSTKSILGETFIKILKRDVAIAGHVKKSR